MLFFQSTTHWAALNLAIEEFLFKRLNDDIVFLYINSASVIIGANQVIRNEVNTQFCKKNNIGIYRRISGGGTVYHDKGNINFGFYFNKENNNDLMINCFRNWIISFLKTLGINVSDGKNNNLWMDEQFKISGTASHHSTNRILFHGTLLYDINLHDLELALHVTQKDTTKTGIASVPSPVCNLKPIITRYLGKELNTTQFLSLFTNWIQTNLGTQELVLNNYSKSQIEELISEKYNNTEWIFKR